MKCFTTTIPIVAALALGCSAIGQTPEKKPNDPKKWEADMAKFEARDKATAPPEGAVLFVGSSSIRMWDLEPSWPGLKVINNGFGGSTLADSVYHFDRHIAPYKNLKAIVIYAGDNDVAKGLNPDEVFADFKKLHGKITKAHPGVPIVFIAIKPSTSRWRMWPTQDAANQKIAALAKEDELLYYADIATPTLGPDGGMPSDKWFKKDGLHLNADGYAEWVKVIKPLLEKAGAYAE